ncbi:acid ceramidase-like [Littorina saxatilis]|uniref:Acid ceramidase n=1 Tax=Littorina saxatilis TaxID=31220 RepID=A0AAN9B1I9_9CAEN
MREIVLLFLAFVAVTQAQSPVQCVKNAYPPDPKTKVPWFTINLDLPPEERWKEVAQNRGAQIRNLLNEFKKFVLDWGSFADKIIAFVDSDLGSLDKTLPYPFAGELQGMSKYSGLNLGEVVLFNIFYEFFTVCTSIVAEDPNGNFVHARNLDFGLFIGWDVKNKTWQVTEALRPLVINLDFQRGGKTVFKSVNFAGYVGILTGLRPSLFSLSMNERFNLDGGYIGILKWLMGDRSEQWMGFLTRSVMENATSYEDAKTQLANTTMLAPAYFILGGVQSAQAAIITRAREKALDVWEMSTITDHPWYVLQTNYDHWEKPLFLDDRRTPGNQCMKNMTRQSVGFPAIFDVLSTEPVLNKLTAYTALMEVKTGKFESYIRYCKDPCFPW